MDSDYDDGLDDPDEQVGSIAEQLHIAWQDGYAAGVAAEKKRRNDQARRSRQLRKLRPRRLT
ncbi:hypothetical protein [Mycolicibacterium fortuitum]